MFIRWIFTQLYFQLRPFIKWFLRHTTKLCELQRVCYGKPAGYERANGVEESLRLSQSDAIKITVNHLDRAADRQELALEIEAQDQIELAVETIVFAKKIDTVIHSQFVLSLGRCLELAWGYRQLLAEVEAIRLTSYDGNNSKHEEMLLTLWSALKPNEELKSRVTKQWQDIGFQGDDPKTDFRGMGLLGLENLVFFAHEFPEAAQHVLSHSLHPNYGYAFAVVGINITAIAFNLVKDGSARTHIFNIAPPSSLPNLRLFHLLYCFLFYEFDKFWIASKPRDVMEFTSIRDRFEKNIRDMLCHPTAAFSIDFIIDTV